MKKHLLACLLAVAAGAAQATMGLMVLPAQGEDGPVTVFHPATAPEVPVQRGPFSLQAALDASPVRGNGRLVVISHGSGGNAWSNADLARELVQAGFVVALPEHKGDNAPDTRSPGPESWKRRPAEVSRAIDAVGRDPRLAPLLSLDRVGMYGMSAGGHTALTLAGGRWSPSRLLAHCEAHLDDDFTTCAAPVVRLRGDLFDGMKKSVALRVIRQRLDDATAYSHDEPRIAAVVAGVPFSADFDFESLTKPRVPLALVTSAKDLWLTPRYHSDRVLQACQPRCELLAHFADGGHGALLSPAVPPEVLGSNLRDLLEDPPGFDRRQVAAANKAMTAFFQRQLLKPQP